MSSTPRRLEKPFSAKNARPRRVRRPAGRRPDVDQLEDRVMLSAAKDAFAHVGGDPALVEGGRALNVAVTSGDFQSPKGKVLIGFLATSDSGKTRPGPVKVVGEGKAREKTLYQSTKNVVGNGSLAIAEVAKGSFDVKVSGGSAGLTGVDAYLVGDVDGNFRVNWNDLNSIRHLYGAKIGQARYNPDADVDHNGIINKADFKLAYRNLNVSTQIRPLLVTLNLAPGTAEDALGRVVSPRASLVGQAEPGATVSLANGIGGGVVGSTVANAQGAYAFTITPALGTNTLQVIAADAFGQRASTLLSFDVTTPPSTSPKTPVVTPPVVTPVTPPAKDVTPPNVTIIGPASGLLSDLDPTIAGVVTDNQPGPLSLAVQVDGGAFAAVALAADGSFRFTPKLALDGSADGAHSVRFQATDKAGNKSSPVSLAFTLDTRPPTASVDVSGTVRTAITTLDVNYSKPVSSSAADPASYVLTVGGQGVPLSSAVALNSTTVQLTLAAPSVNGSYSLAIAPTVTDLAGNALGGTRKFPFTVAVATAITSVSPTDGEEQVGAARVAVVNFSKPIVPATITPSDFYLIAQGTKIPGTIRVSQTRDFATFVPTNPLPSSTQVRIVVDGSQIMGADGLEVDADGDTVPGGMKTVDFSTLPLTRIPNTDVYGYVYDSYPNPDGSNKPIVGATIRVDGLPAADAVTDSKGYFLLKDLPAPHFFVHIDGTTATSAPAGTGYPSVGKEFSDVPGQTIQLTTDDGRLYNSYLPPLAKTDMVPLSTKTATEVGFGAGGKAELAKLLPGVDPSVFDEVQVNFGAGSAIARDGTPAVNGALIPVPPDRLPGPLPAGQNPKLVISIQALGADGQPLANPSFDTPASITFPNLEGLAPGTKSLIWSYKHDQGIWAVDGTGTVSADGKVIVSDGGVIAAPGWHFTAMGTLYRDVANRYAIGSKADYDDPTLLKSENPVYDATPSTEAFAAKADELEIQAITSTWSVLYPTASKYLGHFLSNTGGGGFETTPDYIEPDGSQASNELLADPAFSGADGAEMRALDQLKAAIKAQLPSQKVDFSVAIGSLVGDVFKTSGFLNDLHLAFGELEGLKLTGDGDIEGASDNIAKGTLTFQYSIIYGFSLRDVDAIYPLGSIQDDARFLQLAGLAKPFVAAVEVKVPFEFDLSKDPSVGTLPSPLISEASGFGTDPSVYYRFAMDNGFEIAGKTDSLGQFGNVVLPPDMGYRLVLYSPSTNRWKSIIGTSGGSGQAFGAGDAPGTLDLTEFGGVDTDGDGIPDIGEYVLGTDPNKADTNGDGISDSASLIEGLNPLGSSAFPTGEIASLTLPGSAEAVSVANDLAYVATGGHGLAIVDGTKFNDPILLGQVDTGGTPSGVAVDPGLKIAAVATGSVLALVDVSDPMTPVLTQKVSVGADKVVVSNGFAFSTSGTSLSVVDLQTGEMIDRVALPGTGEVTGLALDGTELYAFVSGSDTLAVVDVSHPEASTVVGQTTVSIASADVGVFAGNGVVWLSGSGLRTVDVGDPTKPKEIHDADFTFTSRRIALNGSGLGLLIPDGGNFVQVYNTSDPAKTNQLLTQFSLSDNARSVAISRGIGYIGTAAGLEVINYEPFDSKGIPPTVSISASPPDADPTTPGVQVLEGTTLPIKVDAADDVQVRDVALLVNGVQVADAVNYPFDLAAFAPLLSTGTKTLTIQVRATDTGGNSTLSNVLTYAISPDRTPPTILGVTPTGGSTRFAGGKSVLVRFSEPIVAAGTIGDDFRLVEPGPDGEFGTSDDVVVPESVSISDNNQLVQILTTNPLDVGTYQLRVNQDAITDRAGNHLGHGPFTSGFGVIARPSIDQLFTLSGAAKTGSFVLKSDVLSLGIDSDGSFITDDVKTGLVFAGVDFITPGDPLAGFTIAHDGSNFTNNMPASGGTSQIAVTLQDLSSGSFHGVRVEGTIGGVLKVERVVAFNDGDQFVTIATRLTNLSTTTTLHKVATLENIDPDQGVPIGVGNATNNSVVDGGKLVIATATTAAFPAGLTIGLGSEDPNSVASAQGFTNTDPFQIIDDPRNPMGASADIAINLAFNFGDLAPGESTSGALIMAVGRSLNEAVATYDAASPETAGPGGAAKPAARPLDPKAVDAILGSN